MKQGFLQAYFRQSLMHQVLCAARPVDQSGHPSARRLLHSCGACSSGSTLFIQGTPFYVKYTHFPAIIIQVSLTVR